MADRWDETWHRLLNWTSGQGPSERLAAQVVQAEGYSRIDPSHPLGGRDRKKDAEIWNGSDHWIMAAYFPRGQQAFNNIRQKFVDDFHGVSMNNARGMAFVTNQQLSLAERDALSTSVDGPVDIFHLDRLAHILDSPPMLPTRKQFLSIEADTPRRSVPAMVSELRSTRRSSLFVGRESAMAKLIAFLINPDVNSQIALIDGMAGSGKTALAMSAAWQACAASDKYEHSLYIDCNGYAVDGDKAVEAHSTQAGILQALGQVEISEDPATVNIAYGRALADADSPSSAILLLLDNVSSIDQIDRVVVPAVNHRYMVTSRNALAVDSDGIIRVEIGPLSEAEAIELVSGQLASAGRQTAAETREETAALADRCGFLPLALRIVTAILLVESELSVGDLTRELADEAERLATLEFDHLNVRTAFSRSYQRLDDGAAEIFRCFSLHPGQEPTTASLSKLVCRGEAATSRLLRRLRLANLLEHGSAPDRWKMHDLLRLYGSEKSLESEPETARQDAQSRLLEHYAECIDHASEWATSTPDEAGEVPNIFESRRDALLWFEGEIENVISCMYLAQTGGWNSLAWRLGISAAAYPPMMYRHDESIAVSTTALAAAESLNDPEREAAALNNLGLALSSARDYDGAIRAFKRGIRQYRDFGDRAGEARLLVGLASSIRERGDAEASIGPLRRSVKLAIEDKDSGGVGFSLTNLGISLRLAGRFDEAINVLLRALAAHRVMGARRAEASTLCQLGTALHQVHRVKDAVMYFKESIVAADEVGDTNGMAMAMMNLGNAYRSAGRFDDAMHSYQESFGVFSRNDDPHSSAMALVNMAALNTAAGRAEAAAELLSSAGQLDPKWKVHRF